MTYYIKFQDIEALDNSLYNSYCFLFIFLADTVRLFESIFISIPWLIPGIFPLIIIFFYISRYFNSASAQFRRISSNSLSSVCSIIQDAYTGASSIRVYGAVGRFRNQFAQKLDITLESNLVELIANCWVMTRLNFFTDFTLLVFIIVAIWFANNGLITIGILGMIMNSSVSVSSLKFLFSINFQ